MEARHFITSTEEMLRVLVLQICCHGTFAALVTEHAAPANVGFLLNLLCIHVAIENKHRFSSLCCGEFHAGSRIEEGFIFFFFFFFFFFISHTDELVQ